MVVKQKVGRKRYIAFEATGCEGDLTRSRLGKTIGKKAADIAERCPYDVIFVYNGRGIVRTDHRHQKALVDLLGTLSIDSDGMKINTLCASGTIRTLKEKYFPNAPP
jgi:RNase P/RNase MRP subunit POP5